MDIARPNIAKKKRRLRGLAALATVTLIAIVTIAVSRLKPALPSIDKGSAWIGTVKRGDMLCQVLGNGTLVPVDIRSIPTLTAGLVTRIMVLPGAIVKSNTVLVELSNPELEQEALETKSKVKAAEADFTNLQAQLDSQKLTQKAAVATAEADYTSANEEFNVDKELLKAGLVPSMVVKQAKAKAEEQDKLLEIEKARLKVGERGEKAQLAAQQEKVTQLKGLFDLKQRQIDALKICAGMPGVLQQLGDDKTTLQVGQALSAGALVACVANPTKLKASIQIPATQAGDIRLNQQAAINTHNGIIPGHVARIDPAVQNDTITVDVALDGPLPEGARPDLNVDGTIQLKRLTNILYVDRPVGAKAESNFHVFKLVGNDKQVVRVPVEFGSASIDKIAIKNGLQVGNKIILSDMSQWDDYKRLDLN